MSTATYLACRRTHPCAFCNVVSTIHKFDMANKVTSCVVFLPMTNRQV